MSTKWYCGIWCDKLLIGEAEVKESEKEYRLVSLSGEPYMAVGYLRRIKKADKLLHDTREEAISAAVERELEQIEHIEKRIQDHEARIKRFNEAYDA